MKKLLLSTLAVLTIAGVTSSPAMAAWGGWSGSTNEKSMDMQQKKMMKMSETETMTIAEIAMNNANFSTLVVALKAAGMADVLNSQASYTVFAPTNDAFAALPQGTLENLLMPENVEQLRDLLQYHVVNGATISREMPKGESMWVETLEGANVKVMRSATNTVMVNDATVVMADVKAKNGVIHAIDQIIMPNM